MNKISALAYRMRLRKKLMDSDIETFTITWEETKRENERRNNRKKGGSK